MDIVVHACAEENSVKEDIAILKKGVHIVVGTLGRIHDMMKKGFLKTDNLRLIVMDEADQMLKK